MKKIAIKFCGQCNALLRLREVYNELVASDENREYSFYKDGEEYDAVLILCGCQAECVSTQFDFPTVKVHPDIGETAGNMASRIRKELL